MLYILYILVVIALTFIDQLSKYYILQYFDLNETLTIIKDFFDLTYIQNYGAGFSILQNQKTLLLIVGFCAFGVLTYLLLTSKKSELLNRVSYLLVMSGCLGNLIDRIRLGFVVDYFDFIIFGYDFPVFNVADCFITIGCFLLIISILKENKNAIN